MSLNYGSVLSWDLVKHLDVYNALLINSNAETLTQIPPYSGTFMFFIHMYLWLGKLMIKSDWSAFKRQTLNHLNLQNQHMYKIQWDWLQSPNKSCWTSQRKPKAFWSSNGHSMRPAVWATGYDKKDIKRKVVYYPIYASTLNKGSDRGYKSSLHMVLFLCPICNQSAALCFEWTCLGRPERPMWSRMLETGAPSGSV